MRSGFVTQQTPASQVAFSPGQDPVVLDETTSPTLRDNLRQRRSVLDLIHQAAGQGLEAEVLRLVGRLNLLRSGVILHDEAA